MFGRELLIGAVPSKCHPDLIDPSARSRRIRLLLAAFAAIATARRSTRGPRLTCGVCRRSCTVHGPRLSAELTSRESPGTGKRRPVTELLLDAQELVVLRE